MDDKGVVRNTYVTACTGLSAETMALFLRHSRNNSVQQQHGNKVERQAEGARHSIVGPFVRMIFLAVLMTATGTAWCGTIERTDFNPGGSGGGDSNIVINAQGAFGLKAKDNDSIDLRLQLYTHGVPFPENSNYPCVVPAGKDTFDILYIDVTTDSVARQRVYMLPGGELETADPVKEFGILNTAFAGYLHADSGTTGHYASLVMQIKQKNDNNKIYPTLVAYRLSGGQVKSVKVEEMGNVGGLRSSQCMLNQDTGVAVYSIDNTMCKICKVYWDGSKMAAAGYDTVFTDDDIPSGFLMNCAVAADETDNIIAMAVYGIPNGQKYLKYKIFNRNLDSIADGKYVVPVADNTVYNYDDVSAVAYAPGKFAVASWDASGILLHKITMQSGNLTHDTTRIMTENGTRFCSISASHRSIVVACMGNVNGKRCVKGKRYRLESNEIDLNSALEITFSNPGESIVTLNDSSSAINSTIDDSGTIAIVWRDADMVDGCIWTRRPVRYGSAYYRSPVDSLPVEDDSLQFRSASLQLSNETSWYTEGWLRLGATPAACTSSAAWISLSDPAVLSGNRTTNRYFQYKIYLSRKETGMIDSLTTPYLSSIAIPWNAKPRILRIDSIRNGDAVYQGVVSGDTLPIIARSDTTGIVLTVLDYDGDDSVTVTLTAAGTSLVGSTAGGMARTMQFKVNPFLLSDTTYTCSLSIIDRGGWQGVPALLYYRTANLPPQLNVHYRHQNGIDSTAIDSIELTRDTTFIVQEEDNVTFRFAVMDSNDRETVIGRFFNDTAVIATVSPNGASTVSVVANIVQPTDTVHYRVEAVDPETTIAINIGLIINHRPVITAVVHDNDTLHDGDTVNAVIDTVTGFVVLVNDTDCQYTDSISYRYNVGNRSDSVTTAITKAEMRMVPDSADSAIEFHVTDRYGRTDSMRIYVAFPWFETDTQENPGYYKGMQRLSDSITLVAGSPFTDSADLPVRNSGRDNLLISVAGFTSGNNGWVWVTLVDGNGDTVTISEVSDTVSHTVSVAPDSTVLLQFHFSAQKVAGDTLRYDTLLLMTNDPRHRTIRIPIRLEYNDLPRIVSVNPDFIADTPWRQLPKRTTYHFPPHAVIALAFSEPMDTVNAADGITVYSVFDKRYTGIMNPIPLSIAWFQNGTVAHITPKYDKSSPSFGVRPPPGLFIPTDSIVVMLSSDLHDRATTPTGPNPLDIDRDYRRDTGSDTSIALRIDSIRFTITEIAPEPENRDVARNAAIKLTFSSPVYAASVDTALINNRSLSVRSEYNDFQPLPFSAITVDSLTVEFRIQRELFYRDSLTCLYHSRWVCDRLGYATDNDRNGIDATIFDSLATDDNLAWGYRIRTIKIVSVEPDSTSSPADVFPMVTMRFDGRIPAGVFDTDTAISNSSFRIGSGRTGYSPLRSIQFLADNTGVVIQPKAAFFSNDSIYCKFSGFSSHYRYNKEENLPGNDTVDCFSSYAWYFHSGKIGFYTFPNPYKPVADPRHCRENGPCGIWFKNLHTLANGIEEVEIRICTMNAHPVFDSRKKGISIRFSDSGSDNVPQWKWDTRNTRGDLVATGIYLYAIYDTRGTVLQKGKLVIVR